MALHMFRKLFVVFNVFVVFMSCDSTSKENTIGNLELSDMIIHPGDELTIKYVTDSVDLSESVYIYSTSNDNYHMDLDFEDNVASISVPDSALAIIIAPKADGKFDANEGKGYVFPLYDAEDKVLVKGQMKAELFALTSGDKFGITTYDYPSVFETWTPRFKEHPELKNLDYLLSYYSIASRAGTEQSKEVVQQFFNDFQSNKQKLIEDYKKALFIYQSQGKNEKWDSLRNVAATEYPKSEIALKLKSTKIRNLQKVDEIVAQIKGLEDEFAQSNFKDDYFPYLYAFAAEKLVNAGQVIEAKGYLNEIKDKRLKSRTLNSLAWDFAESASNLQVAEYFSSESLALINQLLKNYTSEKPNNTTASNFKKSLEYTKSNYADTYALIQFEQGEIKEAIKYQKIAVADGKRVNVNEKYIEYMQLAKDYKTIESESRTFIQNNAASKKIKDAFITAYTKNNPTAKDAEQQLAQMEADALAKFKEELLAKLINEPAPEFSLKDLDGNTVSLADFEGKTVILDFWATWCGPCKISFPAMQKAMKKYENNDNVVFLYVNTWESGANRNEKVQNFLTENKYDFHVLFDEKQESSSFFQLTEQLKIKGIPTKFYIDGKGNIRYESIGFTSVDHLLKQVDVMVETLNS